MLTFVPRTLKIQMLFLLIIIPWLFESTPEYNIFAPTVNLLPRVSLLCLPWSLEEMSCGWSHYHPESGWQETCWVGEVAEYFVW